MDKQSSTQYDSQSRLDFSKFKEITSPNDLKTLKVDDWVAVTIGGETRKMHVRDFIEAAQKHLAVT